MDNLRINLHLSMIKQQNPRTIHLEKITTSLSTIIHKSSHRHLSTNLQQYPIHNTDKHTPYIKENQWFNDQE
jgi:hypothetical protein